MPINASNLANSVMVQTFYAIGPRRRSIRLAKADQVKRDSKRIHPRRESDQECKLSRFVSAFLIWIKFIPEKWRWQCALSINSYLRLLFVLEARIEEREKSSFRKYLFISGCVFIRERTKMWVFKNFSASKWWRQLTNNNSNNKKTNLIWKIIRRSCSF